MSGPIQGKILGALKAMAKAKNAADFSAQPDNTMTASVNAFTLESQHARIKQEIRLMETCIDDLRVANSDWTDLLRKMSSNDREEESAVYDKFQKDKKLADKTDEANDKLQLLRDREAKLAVQAKVYRARADREEREEKLAYARELQAAEQAKPAPRMPTMAPMYQLPTMQLEKFSGQRSKWPEFCESFCSVVDGRSGTKAEKLNLLRSLLDGEPRALIAGLRLEDKNYDLAMQMLKNTYGAKDVFIRDLYNELANLPRCNSVRDSKVLLMEIERITRQLEYAGENVNGPAIYNALEKKLTPSMLRTILIKRREDPASWTTTKFRETLFEAVERETEILETMEEYGHRSSQRQQKWPQQRPQQGNRWSKDQQRKTTFTGSTLAGEKKSNRIRTDSAAMSDKTGSSKNSEQGGRQRPPYPCTFCAGNHWHEECHQHPTTEQREDVIREKKLCYRCLKKGHIARRCPKPLQCFYCKQWHPAALCQRHMQLRNEQSQSSASWRSPAKPEDISQCNAIRKDEDKALLMTTDVTIFNPEAANKSIVATVFIDPGSHKSFITEEAAKKLQLSSIGKADCNIIRFGERYARNYPSRRVKMGMIGIAGSPLFTTLNTTKFIANGIQGINAPALDSEELQQTKLGCIETKTPDVLLGMDLWLELNVSTGKKLQSGFTLCSSRLGNLICGTGQLEQPKEIEHINFVTMTTQPQDKPQRRKQQQSDKPSQRTTITQQSEKSSENQQHIVKDSTTSGIYSDNTASERQAQQFHQQPKPTVKDVMQLIKLVRAIRRNNSTKGVTSHHPSPPGVSQIDMRFSPGPG